MKKFISLALTAAMVASLVPATAFAKTKDGDTINGTVSVVNAWNENKDFGGDVNKKEDSGYDSPEGQIRIGNVDIRGTDAGKVARFTVRLDNANFFENSDMDTDAHKETARAKFNEGIKIRLNPNGVTDDTGVAAPGTYAYSAVTGAALKALYEDLYDALVADAKAGAGTANRDALTYASNLYIVTDANATTANTNHASATGKAAVTGAGLVTLANSPTVTLTTPITSAVSVDTVRDDIWGVYQKTNPENYTYTSDLSTVVMGASSGQSGWYLTANPAAGTSVLEATVVNGFKAGENSAAEDKSTEYAALNGGAGYAETLVVNGNKFKGIEVSPAVPTVDKDTWANTQVTYVTNTAPSSVYTETFTATGDGRPSYGFHRDHLRARIASIADMRKNEIIITVDNPSFPEEGFLENGDIISFDLTSVLVNASKNASVSVTSSDFTLSNDNADFTYVNVDKEAIQLSIRKVVDVAEDEVVTLDNKGLSIKTNVGYFRTGDDHRITLKINGGFEFVPASVEDGKDWEIVAKKDGEPATGVSVYSKDKEEIVLEIEDGKSINEITVYGIDVKAASAKIDKVCTIKATAPGFTSSSAVEVAKVVDYIVNLTVDEDEDVPVIYSGVDVDNTGLTDDSDHWSLDVTAKESFPGAWSFRKGFNFELPDHVFVTDVEVVSTENLLLSDQPDGAADAATPVEEDQVFVAFFNAYQNGSHVNFEFDKRVFDDVDAKLTDDPAEMTFRLQLVADTGFEGDVPLKLTGELVEEQEVTIAKFVKPFEVKAEQNDIIIDYRYTDVPTAITITEAEAGLWDGDKATFKFKLEKTGDTFLAFEDATFEIDSKSGMSIKNDDVTDSRIVFTVDDESDDAAATVTMKNIQLFMNRSIPAGPYDLFIESSLQDAYLAEMLFAPDFVDGGITDEADYRNQVKSTAPKYDLTKEDSIVNHVDDVMDTVKEGFVNVVTAGRDVDDASFTTKVVVPVGENYIVAGEKQIELDTPAYINAAGYTMLPIRAVATALGINNQNVLWDQPTKTVTILYGQRIITMTQGQKVVYVNGSAIPASAAVENTNSRTFLPMRDLATALGVTDIQWDQATRTATLNGNQKGNQ